MHTVQNKFIIKRDEAGYWVQCKICNVSTLCRTEGLAKKEIEYHMKEISNGWHEYIKNQQLK